MKRILIHGALFSLVLFLVLELFFRFVLPASSWPRGVYEESGIRKFDSENFTSGVYTYGRYCRGRYSWSINGQGWNSVFEYKAAAERNKPAVAILGDSYLEGFFSDVDKHIDVFLTDLFQGQVDFYTFAMSGGFLAQYIAIIENHAEQFEPDAYVIFVNTADVAASIRQLSSRHPYYFQYSREPDGSYKIVRTPAASRSPLRDRLLASSLVRYLRSNVQLKAFGGGLADANAAEDPTADRRRPEADPAALREAADFLLSRLDAFGKPVLLVADCPKAWIYEGGDRTDFPDIIVLKDALPGHDNIALLELAPYFAEEFRKSGREFSVSHNNHWDSYTNQFIARTVQSNVSGLLQPR